MALYPAAVHAHTGSTGTVSTADTSTDDSESTEGLPQAMPLQDTPHFEPREPMAAERPALQGATTTHSIMQPIAQSAEPPLSAEPQSFQPAQPKQANSVESPAHEAARQFPNAVPSEPLPADEVPAGWVSEPQAAVEAEHAQQAERPSSSIEGDTFYDAIPVQALVGPLASAAASSAVPTQASPLVHNGPSRAEAAQKNPYDAGAQRQEALHGLEPPTSTLGELTAAANQGTMQRPNGDAGSLQPTAAAEQLVAVTLGYA